MTQKARGARERRASLLRSVGALLAVACLWLFAGPAQFGGPATYVIISGTSMLPRLHSGDLVVTRRSDQYRVGDIVAYRIGARTVVLHRIAGLDGDRFVTKGDNNPTADSARPSQADITGGLWLRVPSAGRLLELLRKPIVLAGLVLLSALSWVLRRRDGLTSSSRQGGGMSNRIKWLAAGPPSPRDERLAMALLAVLVTLTLAIIAYTRPVQRAGTADVSYQQRGAFAYSAAASGGIYDGDRVSSGQPVYLNLVRNLEVGFDYRFAAQATHHVEGTYRMLLELGQDSGWKRTVEIVPSTAFAGDQASIRGSIDLADVRGFLDSFGQQTGVHNSTFSLTVVPVVEVHGGLAGTPVSDGFSPRMVFHSDSNQLVLDRPPIEGDPLSPMHGGAIKQPALVDNPFTILGLRIPVMLARLVTLPAFLLASLVTVGLAQPVLAARRQDEAAQIRARYGPMLLNVHAEAARAQTQHTIELASIDDLLKVASRDGRMILHSNGSGPHQYMVADGETLYRYRATASLGGD